MRPAPLFAAIGPNPASVLRQALPGVLPDGDASIYRRLAAPLTDDATAEATE